MEGARLWPEPLLQLSPAERLDATPEELAQQGLLHPETARSFAHRLFRHQVEAIRLGLSGQSFVVTSGTGSGKTWCFLMPNVDAVVRNPEIPRPTALIVYPMNALVNSQIRVLWESYARRTGRPFSVRFARYTGETPDQEREEIRRDPPHILLANYVMAELMLVRPEERCREALERLLLRAAELNRDLPEPFFAFKLHQFISRGKALYATLEPPTARAFPMEGEVQSGRPRYPLRSCRLCGHECYHVLRAEGQFLPYPVGEDVGQEDLQAGYLTFADDWSEEQIPDDWRAMNGRLRSTRRGRVPQPVWVRPDGSFAEAETPEAVKMWWQAGRLWLCLGCEEYYDAREREFTKLTYLSSEGRSSVTTILATSLSGTPPAREWPETNSSLSPTIARMPPSRRATSTTSFRPSSCAPLFTELWRRGASSGSIPWRSRSWSAWVWSSATSRRTPSWTPAHPPPAPCGRRSGSSRNIGSTITSVGAGGWSCPTWRKWVCSRSTMGVWRNAAAGRMSGGACLSSRTSRRSSEPKCSG